ncbi:hypothetical protein Z517_09202 [Fonsecaea pedrosoi CBS 271.37]|uniref:Uncharacterized protein n=1 Tax=Fonsecaea pedrosoi CBS 271.37 TaxID=1442368 RepID=A0A0D2G7V5_9EURO|nr:uncharacterized protein Z517_09202 [Fonsecaea pedrosoi CBS 271.37]KIW76758.1 hypothetical protein Z517_09202 [Fonsecaea pedrosoi CBS 271.37]
MSKDGNPHTPTRFQRDVDRQFRDRTPIQHDYEAPEDTSKVNCQSLMDQNWWSGVDPEDVERRRREQIQEPPYHRVRIHMRLDMIKRYASNFGLPDLFKTIDGLDRLLSDAGAVADDFENAQREIPDTVKEYWDPEYGFHHNRKEEIERSSYKYDDSPPPASPTHTSAISLDSRSINRRSPSSNAASKGVPRGVSNARVQKKRGGNYIGTRREQRRKRTSERRKPLLQAREEETDTGASLESVSGRGPSTTTLSEKTVPSARASRGRAGTKTKAADRPGQSNRVRKSARIQNQEQKKPLIEKKTKPTW